MEHGGFLVEQNLKANLVARIKHIKTFNQRRTIIDNKQFNENEATLSKIMFIHKKKAFRFSLIRGFTLKSTTNPVGKIAKKKNSL